MTTSETVLIVDGSPRNIEVLSAVLKGYFNLKVAGDGSRALALAGDADKPDLILLAVAMPGMSGHDVCRRLKANEATAGIPVIFVAAGADVDEEARGFDVGAADYIHEPFSPPIVLARVCTHLALRKARADAERTAGESRVARTQAARALDQLHKTKEAAEQSSKELETLLENAWIGVFIITPDRIIRRANRHCEEVIYGWKRGEMIGKRSRIFYRSEEEFDEFGRNAYPHLAAGERYLTREAVFCRKDGTPFLAQAVGSLIDPSDPSRGTIWLVNDITERKAAERRLSQALAEVEIIFQYASVGILYVLDRNVVRVNKTFEAMFGYSSAELIGRTTRFIYESDAAYEAAGREAQAALAAGASCYKVDTTAHRKDGSDLICELVGSLVDTKDPEKGAIWLFSDVTELRHAQEQLRSAKEAAERATDAIRVKSEQVASLLDNSGQGFLSFGGDLVVEPAYSRACELMLGRSPAGRAADDLLFPSDPRARRLMRDCVADAIGESNPGDKSMFLSLVPSETRVGGRTLHIDYIPIETGIMVVLSDVTDERALAQQVARESRRLEMIVAAVTDGGDFFSAIDEFRDFIKGGAAALQSRTPASVYRAIHTFKGTFNQLGFYHLPEELHAVETALQAQSDEAGGELLAATVFAKNWTDLLDWDLRTVVDALGADFLARRGVVTLSPEQAQRYERLAARLLRSNHVGEQDRDPLAELSIIRAVSLRKELGYYDRFIHRIAAALDKDVGPLVLEGEDVRVNPDTFGPLLRSLGHVFRNAVDHGIEDPETRFAAGKNEAGTITCRISRSSKTLRLEIADDGGGIDEGALRRRAAALGVAGGAGLTELVCVDGLSCRNEVTDLSGRGVGMASVRAAAVKLGGDMQVISRPGQGTSVKFEIPFCDDWKIRRF